MAKRKRETIWSFARIVQDARKALVENRRLSEEIAKYRSRSIGQTPQAHTPVLAGGIGVERSCELFCLLDSVKETSVPDCVWHRLHLVWRYCAFEFYVYIERLEQLARENPGKARAGRLPIGDFDAFLSTQFLMDLAFSVVVGEYAAADWLGQKCVKFFTDPPPYVTPDAYTLGPVAPFLLKLYGIWRDIPVDLAGRGISLLKPFQDIFDSWDDPSALEEAVLRLSELHAWKAVNYDLADNDMIFGLQSGIHKDFPSEILFIRQIRRDLGLSVPDPEHPLLRSPLARMPFPCPKSGYDPWLAESLAQVSKDMPSLNIEWEDDFQKFGPTDPHRLPDADFPVES